MKFCHMGRPQKTSFYPASTLCWRSYLEVMLAIPLPPRGASVPEEMEELPSPGIFLLSGGRGVGGSRAAFSLGPWSCGFLMSSALQDKAQAEGTRGCPELWGWWDLPAGCPRGNGCRGVAPTGDTAGQEKSVG